jgi:hypothetical protein
LGSCGLVDSFAHIGVAEVDFAGGASDAVHDGVRGDAVGEGFEPVVGVGLAGDDGGPLVAAVGEDGEEVAGGAFVDAGGEEVSPGAAKS